MRDAADPTGRRELDKRRPKNCWQRRNSGRIPRDGLRGILCGMRRCDYHFSLETNMQGKRKKAICRGEMEIELWNGQRTSVENEICGADLVRDEGFAPPKRSEILQHIAQNNKTSQPRKTIQTSLHSGKLTRSFKKKSPY